MRCHDLANRLGLLCTLSSMTDDSTYWAFFLFVIRGQKGGKNFIELRVVSNRGSTWTFNMGLWTQSNLSTDGEATSDVPEAYAVDENDSGVGFDEWAAVEKKKDIKRRTPLRINSKNHMHLTHAHDLKGDDPLTHLTNHPPQTRSQKTSTMTPTLLSCLTIFDHWCFN